MCFFATSKINITRTAVKLKIKFKKFRYISTEIVYFHSDLQQYLLKSLRKVRDWLTEIVPSYLLLTEKKERFGTCRKTESV